MYTTPEFRLLLVVVGLSIFFIPSEGAASVYDVLQQYDFPVGLLPTGVTSYDFDQSTGKFTVYLNGTCSFKIEDYNLRYKSKITGTISKDRVKDLKGISVKVLFFWLNISEVRREDDDLEFSVGIASASFDVDNFYESPQCGCGFDCNTVQKSVTEFNPTPFVSVS
jgi:hypothetical protein